MAAVSALNCSARLVWCRVESVSLGSAVVDEE